MLEGSPTKELLLVYELKGFDVFCEMIFPSIIKSSLCVQNGAFNITACIMQKESFPDLNLQFVEIMIMNGTFYMLTLYTQYTLHTIYVYTKSE